MKILLISPNRTHFSYRVTPVGLLYLAALLQEQGHQVRLVDLMFSSAPRRDIQKAIGEFRPELIGMGLRNIDVIIAEGDDYLSFYASCVQAIRAVTEAPLVLGGGGFTIFARQLMEILRPDYGLLGEAEESLPLLVRRLGEGATVTDIPGIAYFEGLEVVTSSPARVENLDQLAPQAVELIDSRKYRKSRGVFGVVTKRSCRQQCIFCNDRYLNGGRLRLRSPQLVVEEIMHIRRTTGMPYFAFADSLFNAHPGHMTALLEELIRRRAPIRFQSEMNPYGQDEGTVRLLKRAGCIGVDLTADAGTPAMFRNLGKSYDGDQTLEVARLYAKHRVPYSVGFLLGGPGENAHTVAETIRFAESLPSPNIVYFSVGLTVLPHSPLARTLESRGGYSTNGHPLDIGHYVSDDFDGACARALVRACDRNPRFYISNTFFLPIMKTSWKMLDWMNVRPSWKDGTSLHHLFKLLPARWTSLTWDARGQRFVGAAQA
jgi:radical SAM superfamily enzyme YgiQ (UPF0313 family)